MNAKIFLIECQKASEMISRLITLFSNADEPTDKRRNIQVLIRISRGIIRNTEVFIREHLCDDDRSTYGVQMKWL